MGDRKTGGCHAIAPARLAGMSDQNAANGSGGGSDRLERLGVVALDCGFGAGGALVGATSGVGAFELLGYIQSSGNDVSVRTLAGTDQSFGWSVGLDAGVGTNQSSIPSELAGFVDAPFGGAFGWTRIRGKARVRHHCEGSTDTNGKSESDGIASPACAEMKKGSRWGALVGNGCLRRSP